MCRVQVVGIGVLCLGCGNPLCCISLLPPESGVGWYFEGVSVISHQTSLQLWLWVDCVCCFRLVLIAIFIMLLLVLKCVSLTILSCGVLCCDFQQPPSSCVLSYT